MEKEFDLNFVSVIEQSVKVDVNQRNDEREYLIMNQFHVNVFYAILNDDDGGCCGDDDGLLVKYRLEQAVRYLALIDVNPFSTSSTNQFFALPTLSNTDHAHQLSAFCAFRF
ncbi:MAG: hypothetical protein EZS28_001873 [Streblomastix strix]|uniref:Uncharacterized protein n=1 Tax=Streblomastix strix TaxID=222440 RepID=A0A5J4X5T4_9EUKA|nr:MAG: hypothetical protein EZS28_001873 [Streblomastix strix]